MATKVFQNTKCSHLTTSPPVCKKNTIKFILNRVAFYLWCGTTYKTTQKVGMAPESLGKIPVLALKL